MNNYLVLLTDVMKFAHPFRDKLFPEKVYLKEIDQMLAGTLNTKYMQYGKVKILEETVSKINYYYPKEIELNLTQDSINNKSDAVSQSSLIDLAAAIYRHEKHIVCTITGDKELAQSLLKINLDKPDNIVLPVMNNSLKFDWEIEELQVSNAWDDIDFIIDYLNQPIQSSVAKSNKTISDVRDERLKEVVKFSTPEVWDNQELVNKVMSFHFKAINYLSFEILLNKTILHYVKHHISDFDTMWDRIYKYLYNDKGDFDQTALDMYDEPYKSQIFQNLKTIDDELFSNKKFVINLCQNPILIEKFFSKIPPEIKYSNEILKELAILANNKNNPSFWRHPTLFKDLPNEFSQNIEWVQNLFTHHNSTIAWHMLPNDYKISGMENIFKLWINDKDLVLKFMKESPSNQFYKVFELLPPLLKNDDNMIKIFMDIYPVTYTKLPPEKKPPYLKNFIMGFRDDSNIYRIKNHVTVQAICDLNDKEIFMHLAEQGYTDWFTSTFLDKKWHQDIDVVRKVAEKNEAVYDLPHIKDILIQLPREQLAHLITKSRPAYEKLTGEMRNDHELALLCIKYHKDSPNISNNLYWSKSFCVEALKNNVHLIKKVPKEFWKQKDFILGICKGLDDKTIPVEILNDAPVFVKPFFDSFAIKENYTTFMENYLLRIDLERKLVASKSNTNKKKI